MKTINHVWGPWHQKVNAFGEALNYGVRKCERPDDDCHITQSLRIPSLGEVEAMSRKEYRRWQAGKWNGY